MQIYNSGGDMKNRGFSLVELIVTIAIIAIIIGVAVPALAKYIGKARLSSDIDTGKEIAKAIMSAVADENIRDNAEEFSEPHPISDMKGGDFKKQVYEILKVDSIEGKSKKDVDGDMMQNGNPEFYYTLDSAKNKVEIFYGGTDADHQIYPVTGKKLLK